MMGCLRVRGRSCKPPQFLLVKSEMKLVNGKRPWKKNTGVWFMKQKPLNEPVDLSMLNPEDVEFVPGKLVTVRKAGPNGGKKKCRAVVCGNLLQSDLDPAPGNLYASGADGILIRATLAHSVQRGWGIGTTDVRTAFLLAPRPQPLDSREVIVVPPKVMVEAGVGGPTERWRVHNALYGFTSSPAHWAIHRDSTMGNFNWDHQGDQFFLKRTEEGNLWKILNKGSNGGEPTCEGNVIVYVMISWHWPKMMSELRFSSVCKKNGNVRMLKL